MMTETSEARERGVSAFWVEVHRLMDERGIEDLENLYSRFMAQEPERIGNAKWTLERFRQHVHHEVSALYERFIVPLCEALEATDHEEAGLFLAWVNDAIDRGRAEHEA